ncbi:carbonic anhydrase [Oikeobacillus pervagus]|uniref:Carbonic anhydrase n=1 Tax=Oikeobacillus pervagus TaxID=1325931 RepID=A0AAJ1T4C1_9BACI|nr:carbonic anhydrase [Oikeobacillus pervagus]MDQ0216386.1 carbonic anhydrase [Oikeobacillus pervagus]
MCTDKKKKLLLVIGMDHNIEQTIKENTNLNLENILILQSYQPITSPFGDLMRDIIIAVYQENIEEIGVTATADRSKQNLDVVSKMISANKELQKKVQIFDYLFKYCRPEFQEENIKEWLKDSGTLKVDVQTSINMIKNHPLIPPSVKVRKVTVDKEELAI